MIPATEILPDSLPAVLLGLETQIDSLRETGAMLWQRGWSVGTSSNYSVVLRRQPLELLVTASGMDKGRLKQADFVLVNERGEPSVAGGSVIRSR